ncbi:uncharacterized protein BXZ73DRAFT_29345, partial [Epithele typhae]|uniref:uncharacterized protein n=1 Tax=Epithele typhae TaxID=378194 RepID=UPI002007765E
TEEEKADAWARTVDVIKTYSDEMVRRWNAEIDTLLVYAGLFSAILTAFNVQSYPLLQPNAPDPVLVTLQQISQQLSGYTVHAQNVTSSSSAPARSDVWLNILWFSSLICSLSSASIGIMVKQWLNEYSTGLSGSSHEIARLRQHRLDNLAKWRVAEIVALLP